MERELWTPLYRLLRQVGAEISQAGVTYQPGHIAAVLLWAALHDRPVSWACQRRHWPPDLRPARLPAPSTMSRRLDDVAVGLVLRGVEARLAATAEPALDPAIDGKPLVVGGASKDPEAKAGRAARGMARGYKLHAVWGGRPVPEAWEVEPLNVCETVVARRLLARLGGGGYLLGDSRFDSSGLHDAAAARGYQLVAPGSCKATGRGHCYQSPHRRRCRDLLAGAFGRGLYDGRRAIERSFGNATSFGGGLGPLPAWVRRLHRVRRWVAAKLLINGARIVVKRRLTA
jgi:hypothetical protein